MNRDELISHAVSLGIRPDAYDLSGMSNESYAIVSNGAGYDVFYSERGLRKGVESFPSEPAASEHLLKLLTADPTTRSA